MVCISNIPAKNIILCFLIYFSFLSSAHAYNITIDKIIDIELKKKHDKKTVYRFKEWRKLINKSKELPAINKVKLVNNFFNNKNIVEYAEDIYIWGQLDYWATPIEFVFKAYGDCEDYAIAKYYTLLAMGIKDNDLRVTYVKFKTYQYGINKDLAHMVLSFYPPRESTPLVLDNVNKKLIPATKRDDIKFIYSFNGTKLWVAKSRKYGVYVGTSRKLGKWAKLIAKIRLN